MERWHQSPDLGRLPTDPAVLWIDVSLEVDYEVDR
jgi:hypothetical protein